MTDSTLRDQIEALRMEVAYDKEWPMAYNSALDDALRLLDAYTAAQPDPDAVAENDSLKIAAARRALKMAQLTGRLKDVIEMWEWCGADPADRGWSPLSDAINDARIELAKDPRP